MKNLTTARWDTVNDTFQAHFKSVYLFVWLHTKILHFYELQLAWKIRLFNLKINKFKLAR